MPIRKRKYNSKTKVIIERCNMFPDFKIFSLFDEHITVLTSFNTKEIKMPDKYPRTVLIQPTQAYMNHNGYFNDENQSENDIDEYDFVLGTKRREFDLEDETTILPQGYELVHKQEDDSNIS